MTLKFTTLLYQDTKSSLILIKSPKKMTPTNEFMRLSIKRVQVQKPLLVSEKLISLIFGILVTVFSIALILGFQALAVHLSSGVWKWGFTNPISNLSSFVLNLTFCIVLVISCLKLYLVINKLFQSFWESLEE